MVLPEAHLVKVPLHIFYTVMMMGSKPLPFYQTPKTFDIICVYPAPGSELPYRMINRKMYKLFHVLSV
jgi:hypothetical protein